MLFFLKKTGGVLSVRNKVYLKKRRKEFTGDIMTLPQITKVKVGDKSPETQIYSSNSPSLAKKDSM